HPTPTLSLHDALPISTFIRGARQPAARRVRRDHRDGCASLDAPRPSGSARVRIFVTGATSFLGAHFVRSAKAAGHEVIASTRRRDRKSTRLNSSHEWT